MTTDKNIHPHSSEKTAEDTTKSAETTHSVASKSAFAAHEAAIESLSRYANTPAMQDIQAQSEKLQELAETITLSPAMEAVLKLSEQSSVFAGQLQKAMKPFSDLSEQLKSLHIPSFELPDFALSQLGKGWDAIQKQQDLLKSLSNGIAACEAAKIALSPRDLSPAMSELSKIKEQFSGTTYETVTPEIRKTIVSDINELETIAKNEKNSQESIPAFATRLSLTLFAALPNAVNTIIASLAEIHIANQTIADENKIAINRLTAVMESNAKISGEMLAAGKANTNAIVELISISKTTLEATQTQLEIIKNNYVEASKQWKRSDRKTNWALGLAITSIVLSVLISGFSCWLAHRDSDSTTAAIKMSQEANSRENQETLNAILKMQRPQPVDGDKQ